MGNGGKKKLCQIKDYKTWNCVKTTPPSSINNLHWDLHCSIKTLTIEHAYTQKHAGPCDGHAAFAEDFGKKQK